MTHFLGLLTHNPLAKDRGEKNSIKGRRERRLERGRGIWRVREGER